MVSLCRLGYRACLLRVPAHLSGSECKTKALKVSTDVNSFASVKHSHPADFSRCIWCRELPLGEGFQFSGFRFSNWDFIRLAEVG